MKKLFLAALTVLSLSAGVANAATLHNGPYDNTGHGPQSYGLQGGGG
jgi:hypothetical protein